MEDIVNGNVSDERIPRTCSSVNPEFVSASPVKAFVIFFIHCCSTISSIGVKQFEGTTEYEIKEVIPVFGINKYLVMNADGLAEVRLVK